MTSRFWSDSSNVHAREATDLLNSNRDSATHPLLYQAIVLTMVGVLFIDFLIPLGIAIWIVYLIPVSLSLWVWRPTIPLYVASAATAFILLTIFKDDSTAVMEHSIALTNRAFGLFAIWVVAIIGFYFVRYKVAAMRERWLQSGQTGLSEIMSGELQPEQLARSVLRYLAEFLDAHAGAFFIKDNAAFRNAATYGVAVSGGAADGFITGDGLLGQAAQDNRFILLSDVPDNYLQVQSALGQSKPRHLLIVPVEIDRVVNSVFELGFLHPIPEPTAEFLTRVGPSIGVAIRSANYRVHLQNLLEETQRQSEELQAQSEELRVSNEELEEQGRALRETQTRLMQQQAELEETNTQLEEQTQELEAQRDSLAMTQASLEAKARELEQASRYKSDFLANMSHELRTPLNSSLILSRLLADNPQGNLTEEQVRFAETIQASGNDLLSLINDILDLSKIEAGKMDVRLEAVHIRQLITDLNRLFEPQAQQKGLSLKWELQDGVPASIVTDRQRLEQILKNLLSNAIKFTDKGGITLTVQAAPNNQVSFAVQDTGIGIAPHQQQTVFEAFRQADGTTSRKYGGTGLGLSISRELTRLLAGHLHLASEVGKGSTFTVTFPVQYDHSLVPEKVGPLPTKTISDQKSPEFDYANSTLKLPESSALPTPVSTHPRVPDDRSRLHANSRVLLVVEDDDTFAKILYDMAHELNFQCLVASTAEDAVVMAVQYLPSGVVLDIGLPDHSGLSVLDRLKHDSRTRHIPVHVVSAGDFAETSLSLGAVGYLLKPVKREDLVNAMQRLETQLSQRMRRVLVVEDDAVQLDSLRKLLASHQVETLGAQTAAECLELLKNNTFDCMVLDLTLPDTTGYSLLETLSREEAYSFPPVIVYTGQELTSAEEQSLRRYSKSIIIKGAKSPERLLDEVTLFLHQVVSELPPQQQRMLEKARSRDAILEGRRILIVEDDVRNVFALTSILEQRGAITQIARNGLESLKALEEATRNPDQQIDLILMDVMMPEMDGLTAVREIRKRGEWKRLPIIMLTAKAMKDDHENCLEAGANDYMAKPLDIDKLLSLVRVWLSR